MLGVEQVQSQSIDALTADIVAQSKDEKFVPFHFWSEWLHCAAASSDVHEALLALAHALQTHSVRTIDGQCLWTDLPTLPWAIREGMDTLADPHHTSSFVNIHTFLSRCAADGLVDTTVWAAVLFRELLEDDAVQEDKDAYIAAADAWIQHAGATLYHDGIPHHTSSPLCRAGARWQGPGGFSSERLAFWNRRLREVCADGSRPAPAHLFPE